MPYQQTDTNIGVLRPEQYGATAGGISVDGVWHDDTFAIQTCLLDCAYFGRRMVLTPGKIYLCSGQLTVPTNTEIEGNGATIQASVFNAHRLFLIQNVSHVKIRNLFIDMNNSATLDSGSNGDQQGIYITHTVSVTDITLENVSVVNCWYRGIVVSSNNVAIGISHLTIANCTVTNTGDAGIFIGAISNTDRVTPSNSRDIHIVGNSVSLTAGVGIQLYGVSYFNCDNNHVEGGINHGICFSSVGTNRQCSDFTFNGNKVYNQVGTSVWGILVSNSCTRFSGKGNIVRNCTGGISVDPEDSGNLGVRINVMGVLNSNIAMGSLSSHGINVRMLTNLTINDNLSCNNAQSGVAISNAYACGLANNTANGNTQYGVAILGTNAGSGGHTIGPNATRDNTLGDLSNSTPPIACKFVTAA